MAVSLSAEIKFELSSRFSKSASSSPSPFDIFSTLATLFPFLRHYHHHLHPRSSFQGSSRTSSASTLSDHHSHLRRSPSRSRRIMRATAAKLLNVKPLPASAFPSLRLPPSASAQKASVAATSARPSSASADVAAELEKKVVSRQELGENVRISNHISNKDLYWKVSTSIPYIFTASCWTIPFRLDSETL